MHLRSSSTDTHSGVGAHSGEIIVITEINLEGNPIFSCDVHPDGSRFATGGQGQDCGQVTISLSYAHLLHLKFRIICEVSECM